MKISLRLFSWPDILDIISKLDYSLHSVQTPKDKKRMRLGSSKEYTLKLLSDGSALILLHLTIVQIYDFANIGATLSMFASNRKKFTINRRFYKVKSQKNI